MKKDDELTLTSHALTMNRHTSMTVKNKRNKSYSVRLPAKWDFKSKTREEKKMEKREKKNQITDDDDDNDNAAAAQSSQTNKFIPH